MTIEAILRLAEADADAPLGRLVRGNPVAAACQALRSLTVAPERNAPAARSALAGAWVAADGFAEAHALAQELEGEWGDWWHAILHRREPDFGNALYWYRRVNVPQGVGEALGTKVLEAIGADPGPDLQPLAEAIKKHRRWEPGPFVGACEAARAGRVRPGSVAKLVAIQRLEWRAFLEYCLTEAAGR